MNSARQEILSIAFYCWVVAAEIIKVGYLATCQCSSTGFTSWIWDAFHHWPYTFWHTYRGTRFLAGPYSFLWWFLDLPAFFGYPVFFGFLLVVDLVVFCLLARRSRGYAIYFVTLSVWFVTVDPVDFWIIVFAVAGRYSRFFLALAPITKLPFGSELLTGGVSVWTWTFTSRDSFSGPENYGRYLILASVWLLSLVLYLYGKRKKRERPESNPQTVLELAETDSNPVFHSGLSNDNFGRFDGSG